MLVGHLGSGGRAEVCTGVYIYTAGNTRVAVSSNSESCHQSSFVLVGYPLEGGSGHRPATVQGRSHHQVRRMETNKGRISKGEELLWEAAQRRDRMGEHYGGSRRLRCWARWRFRTVKCCHNG